MGKISEYGKISGFTGIYNNAIIILNKLYIHGEKVVWMFKAKEK